MRAAKAAKDLPGIADALSSSLREVLQNLPSGKELSEDKFASCLDYLQEQVSPLLVDLFTAICAVRPSNPMSYGMLWLAQQLHLPEAAMSNLRNAIDEDSAVRKHPSAPGRPNGSSEESGIRPPPNPKPQMFSPQTSRLRKSVSIAIHDPDDEVPAATNRRLKRMSTITKPVVLLTEDDIVDLMRKVPFLSSFPEEDVRRVAQIAETRVFEPGDNIVTCGEICNHLHIIVEGKGQVFIPQAAGEMKKGDFLGEEALKLANARNEMQLSAGIGGGTVTTLCVRRDAFEDLGLVRRVERKKNVIQSDDAVPFRAKLQELQEGVCVFCGHKLVENYEQTDADRLLIMDACRSNKVLGEVVGLNDEQCSMVADMVHLVEIEADKQVFAKGDIGNALFIVQEGLLAIDFLQSEILVKPGVAFGELALMYDAPRSATVKTKLASKLWVMPRHEFGEVCRMGAEKTQEEHIKLLQSIPSLATVDKDHLEALQTCLEETTFLQGEEICVKGKDEGVLYIIFEGTCSYVDGDSKDAATVQLGKGSWVGEEQLLQNISADKTVTVDSDIATILVLTNANFVFFKESTNAQDSKAKRRVSMSVSGNSLGDDAMTPRTSGKKKLMGSVLELASKFYHHSNSNQESIPVHNCVVLGALGEGSFGQVVLLRDPESNKEYALKGISKELLRKENHQALVKNERQIMSLLDSGFIVRFYGGWTDTRYVYLVLEPALGGELFEIYTEQKFWGNASHARFYLACVSLALAHLHSKRVIWRDLKMENCLVDSKGYLKLTDMGIAKVVVGKTYTVCGTADYFAPETLKQVGHNRAADWWACGVLLYIMIVGRGPFEAPEVPQIYKNIIKGIGKVTFPKSVPADAEAVVRSLCSKKPEDRPPMLKGGIENLKLMPFFKGIAWDDLVDHKLAPPFVPEPPDYEKIGKRVLEKNLKVDLSMLEPWSGDSF